MAVLVAVAAACQPEQIPPPPSTGPSPATAGRPATAARVVSVTDGDTIRVIVGGREEPVRLIGIDTPEVDWYGGDPECFGERAGLYTRRRLAGREVRLAFDVDRRDRYDRLLAYVFVTDEHFNLTLVRHGYAIALEVSPNLRYASAFQRAEERAREEGLGLWSACG